MPFDRCRMAHEREWTHHNHIPPPGLVGILALFVYLGALERLSRYATSLIPDSEKVRHRAMVRAWLRGQGVEYRWVAGWPEVSQ